MTVRLGYFCCNEIKILPEKWSTFFFSPTYLSWIFVDSSSPQQKIYLFLSDNFITRKQILEKLRKLSFLSVSGRRESLSQLPRPCSSWKTEVDNFAHWKPMTEISGCRGKLPISVGRITVFTSWSAYGRSKRHGSQIFGKDINREKCLLVFFAFPSPHLQMTCEIILEEHWNSLLVVRCENYSRKAKLLREQNVVDIFHFITIFTQYKVSLP